MGDRWKSSSRKRKLEETARKKGRDGMVDGDGTVVVTVLEKEEKGGDGGDGGGDGGVWEALGGSLRRH